MNKKTPQEEFPGMSGWLAEILEDWKQTYLKIGDLTHSDKMLREVTKKLETNRKQDLAKLDVRSLGGWRKRWFYYLKRRQNRTTSEEDPFTIDPDEPSWVCDAEQSTMKAWAPTVNIRNLKDKPALAIGGLIGHAHATWGKGEAGLEAAVERVPEELRDYFRCLVGCARTEVTSMIKRSLTLAVEQSLSASRDFFRGFSLAVQKGSYHDTGALVGQTEAGLMKFYMLLHQEFVQRGVENDEELHEWLVSQLGEKSVWNRKALWKLRSEMGVKFYRSPGRPRNS